MNRIKKRLEAAKGNWVEELPGVLWAYRTTKRKATGETPFSLAYGSEAIIPVEIGMPTLRTQFGISMSNIEELNHNLDLLEEKREQALIRLEAYHERTKLILDKKSQI